MSDRCWPLLVLWGAIVVKLASQLVLTRGSRPGTRRGYLTTGLLFAGYTTTLAVSSWQAWHLVNGPFVYLVGGLLFAVGFAIRTAALWKLGAHFSSFVEIRPDHELISDGIYAIVRHPLHLGFLLEAAGLAVYAWHPAALGGLLVVVTTVLVRNVEEERTLREHFPTVYDEYARDVPSLDAVTGVVRRWRRR